jgi:hypothetical protein
MKYILLLCTIIVFNANASITVSDTTVWNQQSQSVKKSRPDKDFSVIKKKHSKKTKNKKIKNPNKK